MALSRRQIFAILISAFVLLMLPLAVFFTRKGTDLRSRALSGQANLLLSAGALNGKVGETNDVLVSMQLTNSAVRASGVDFTLYYDKTKLAVAGMRPAVVANDSTAAFTDLIYETSGGTVDSTYNFLRIVEVARRPTNELPSGTIPLATITFNLIGEGAASLKFPDDNTLMQIVGVDVNNPNPTSAP